MAGKVAPLPLRLALRAIQPRLRLSYLVFLGSAFGRGGLEDTSSSYKTQKRDMTQVEKREAQTGALAEVFCQPSELLQLSVMHYRRPADFIKVGIFQRQRGFARDGGIWYTTFNSIEGGNVK